VGAGERGDAVRVAAEVVEAVFNAHISLPVPFLVGLEYVVMLEMRA
jgi:hypothetical protein